MLIPIDHRVLEAGTSNKENHSVNDPMPTKNIRGRLLSFAQFEREIAGESIRDKIARRRGRACGWAKMCGSAMTSRRQIDRE
jgi:hypothetical protein